MVCVSAQVGPIQQEGHPGGDNGGVVADVAAHGDIGVPVRESKPNNVPIQVALGSMGAAVKREEQDNALEAEMEEEEEAAPDSVQVPVQVPGNRFSCY